MLAYNLPLSYVQDYTIARSMKQPTMVFFGQTGERAREMFVTTLADKATPSARRIGPNRFEDMYPGLKVGKVTDWSFKASRGDSVRGFYILPPDFDASRKYPLIVYYYGGCTPTGKSLQFQYPLQVLAGQGYVIYVCEPSGAIGYGQEFAARHVNTWGQESGDDIIEGTKAFLAAHPFVDSKRVGCMGASYGGFMTQYLQTRTDIFAAAISHAGISNIASYWGGGYWGYTYGQTAQYGSYPWNNPDLYVKQSPLFNADKIHTPLLLLHGTADTNVPTNESQQLFTALKILGREVSYIQVEGENHVIVDYRQASGLAECNLRMVCQVLEERRHMVEHALQGLMLEGQLCSRHTSMTFNLPDMARKSLLLKVLSGLLLSEQPTAGDAGKCSLCLLPVLCFWRKSKMTL